MRHTGAFPAVPPRDDVPQDNPNRSNAEAATGSDPGGTYFLGRYRVVDEIGLGGMASVHLARMDGPGGFQRWVAIKKIHAHLIEDESFVQMFLDEARVAARINHPNVVSVYDLGKHDDTYWIAMEYLHGEALREIMRRTEELGTAMPPEIACRVIADAAEGLHAAHELLGKNGEQLDLVHRDVTPHNLFVTYDGVTKVVDFGIAKFASRMSTTRAGTLKGKLAYMSPEQVQGEQIDRRTDIFALGVVLWELTTGQRLFRMENDLDTLAKVQECNVPRPSTLIRGYPIDLEKIVMKALSKNRAERFRTAREFSRALQGLLMRRGLFVASDEVSGYIRSIFQDRIAKREAHLKWASEVTQMHDVDKLENPVSAAPPAVESAPVAFEHVDVNATPLGELPPTYSPPQSGSAIETAALPNAPQRDQAKAAIESIPVPVYSEPASSADALTDEEEDEPDDETVVAPTRVEAPPEDRVPMHSPSFGSFASPLETPATQVDTEYGHTPFVPPAEKVSAQMPSAAGHYQRQSGAPLAEGPTLPHVPPNMQTGQSAAVVSRMHIPTLQTFKAVGTQALTRPPPWAIVVTMALLVVTLGSIARWIFASPPQPIARGTPGPFASARGAFSAVLATAPPPPAPPVVPQIPNNTAPAPAESTPAPAPESAPPAVAAAAEPHVPKNDVAPKSPFSTSPAIPAAHESGKPKGGMGAISVVCQKARCDQIVIDGVSLGGGNVFARPASAGKHTINLSATNGVKKTTTVDVVADQTKDVRVPMDR